ncbi:hypothetical protein VCR8J2_250342 [Vibrio coralliirubri]|nr:hypothetical protein VCR8J2_250342 [Vibrio coralliirubri]
MTLNANPSKFTRYSLLATRYSLLATRYSLLATRYSLLATRLVRIFRPTIAIRHVWCASDAVLFVSPFPEINHLTLLAAKRAVRALFTPFNVGITLRAFNDGDFLRHSDS